MLETVLRRPKTGEKSPPLTVRLPDELLDLLREIADAQDRSLKVQIVRALREWLAQQPRTKP